MNRIRRERGHGLSHDVELLGCPHVAACETHRRRIARCSRSRARTESHGVDLLGLSELKRPVIAGEISETKARSLLRFVDRLQAIAASELRSCRTDPMLTERNSRRVSRTRIGRRRTGAKVAACETHRRRVARCSRSRAQTESHGVDLRGSSNVATRNTRDVENDAETRHEITTYDDRQAPLWVLCGTSPACRPKGECGFFALI